MSPLIALTGIGGIVALAAFLLVERRSPNPMMPLETFSSRQFSAANLVTFAVYAALGGFFFLFVAFLQISLGYSPIEAGAASLPVTLLMLVALGPLGRSRPAHRGQDPAHRRPARDRCGPVVDDADRPG